ncbi:hypothetical protein QNH10_13185 [Sporosarcina thermotolerans]|uniref:hypothetical protein n=1 Tax=Sporosarcina thermotolerans TaxID=633404 RepID=UPI0024BCEE41|nr:hypothetical protein [Sporosarcina thermotolerans]WHT47191.1 hypothetical protein QNH10_13185 [Sporosarcina thermotolerans]
MIRLCLTVILSGLLLLSACNPKPEVVEPNVEVEKTFTILDQPEKMFEFDNVFKSDLWISAVNQLARYYDVEVTQNELPEIGIRYLDGHYSVMDVFDIYRAKGLIVYPKYASYDDIETAVFAGKPVYAKFNLIGNNSFNVIFYGYSDDELMMMDLTTGKDRVLNRNRLSTVNVFDAFIPYNVGEVTEKELESSVRYLEMFSSDAYYGNDGERLRTYLNIIDEKQLESEVNAYNYTKCYYYTFFLTVN